VLNVSRHLEAIDHVIALASSAFLTTRTLIVSRLTPRAPAAPKPTWLREVLIEVHRVVQKSDDLDRASRGHAIEHDVPRVPAGLLDVVAEDAWPNAANLAAARVGGDGFEGVADEVAVFQRLSFAPPVSRAAEDVGDVAPRERRAE
jgi:hypothetical protein